MRDISTFVISLTPFTQAGALDEEGLRDHLRRLGDSGIGVYVGGSGSGEGYTLTPDEVRRLMEVAAEELSGRVPVRMMGVEPRTAQEAIELARAPSPVGGEGAGVECGHFGRSHPSRITGGASRGGAASAGRR